MGHIFISYSHKDTGYAKKLVSALQKEGFDPWVDERLDYGSQWPLELQENLDTCEAFIVLMSPSSLASEWVQSELSRAKRKNKRIFPLLLEGEETWLSVESTQYVDVRGGVLPPEKFYEELAEVTPRGSGSQPRLESASAPVSRPPVARTLQIPGLPALTQTQILIAGAVLGLLILVGFGSWGLAQLAAPLPTPTTAPSPTAQPEPTQVPPTLTAEPQPTATPTEIPSVTPTAEPTLTLGPTLSPTPLAKEMVDPKGVSMVLVPAGKFSMGSNEGDLNEKPVHLVYLDTYYIDKFEVTNARYRACVQTGICQAPLQATSFVRADYYDSARYDNFPVIYVNWEMAKTYCEWRGARLPTEAEWEKAARGTDRRVYPWGNEPSETHANYNQSVGDTIAVGSYQNGRSPYGAYDMAGNVWEWVADWYQDNYYASLGENASNPQGPASGQEKVLRGGSFYYGDYIIRSANRGWNDPTGVGSGFGFRCALGVR